MLPLAAMMGGCADDSSPDAYNGTGALDVSLTVVAPEGLDVDGSAMPATGDFALTLTSAANGASHRWTSFDDYEQGSGFTAGKYTVSAIYSPLNHEGMPDALRPAFAAEEEAAISEGQTTSLLLRAQMTSAVVTVNASDGFITRFGNDAVTLHALNGGFVKPVGIAGEYNYLKAGSVGCGVTVGGAYGPLALMLQSNIETRSGKLLPFRLDYDPATLDLTATWGDDGSTTIAVTKELLSARAPIITVSADILELTEHTSGDKPLTFTVEPSTSAPLANVFLSISSASLYEQGCPPYIDLAHPSESDLTFMRSVDMEVPRFEPGKTTVVNLDNLIDNLEYRADGNNTTQMSISAVDAMRRTNTPVVTSVVTLPAELSVESVSDAVIGVNRADITVVSPSQNPEKYLTVKAGDTPLAIGPGEPLGEGRYRISVTLPEGNEPLDINILYNGTVKASATIRRVSPDYNVALDAFATYAMLRIDMADDDLRDIVTDNLSVWIDGAQHPVYARDTERNAIYVMGLTPATRYSLRASLLPRPSEKDPEFNFVTERAAQLPNPSFEDVKHTIELDKINSGGRYSQTYAEIYNWQNTSSFDEWTPTKWAMTNAKTFNKSARNMNTWYVQPSVVSTLDAMDADYGVELISVAFDPAGPEIAPYRQESEPYVRYSRNIPEIAYRAAGRIFLGSYNFDAASMTETYNEGLPFASRPTSLNGFYQYRPAAANPADRGLVEIELFGEENGREIVIASAETRLSPATGYAAFNIPLSYNRFGIKATRIKVMFSSSDTPTGIATESINVKTDDDPVSATSIGSRLKLDNITLAY